MLQMDGLRIDGVTNLGSEHIQFNLDLSLQNMMLVIILNFLRRPS